jgi:protein-tyrosine phosphatase
MSSHDTGSHPEVLDETEIMYIEKKRQSPITNILFVCLGNICRSPLAEAIFLSHACLAGVEDQFKVDSAGTGRWHVGEQADPRTIEIARRNGITINSLSRQITNKDFKHYDLILAMDQSNLLELQTRCQKKYHYKLKLMRTYDKLESHGADVPDPYWSSDDGFEQLFKMLSFCCLKLLTSLMVATDESP